MKLMKENVNTAVRKVMKGTVLLSVSFCLFAGICIGQDTNYDNKKFTFGFNIGNGYPVSDYGNISTSKLPMSIITRQDTSKMCGYAKPGFHYNAFVTYKIVRHVNIMLFVSGDKDSYDINTLNLQYNEYFPPNTVSVFTGDEFYASQYLAGPKLNFPVSKYISIEFKALFGLTTLSVPNLTYYRLKDTLVYSYPLGSGFGYNIGAGIKYTVQTEGALGLGFHLGLNYAGAVIKYSGYTTYESSNTNNYSTTYNLPISMVFGMLEATIGVSLEL